MVQNACLFALVDLLAHSTLFTVFPLQRRKKSHVLPRFNRSPLCAHGEWLDYGLLKFALRNDVTPLSQAFSI